MAQQAVIDQPLAEQAARLHQAERQLTFIERIDVEAVALAEGPAVVCRLLGDAPLFPGVVVRRGRPEGRVERLVHHDVAAAGGGALLPGAHGVAESGAEAAEQQRSEADKPSAHPEPPFGEGCAVATTTIPSLSRRGHGGNDFFAAGPCRPAAAAHMPLAPPPNDVSAP